MRMYSKTPYDVVKVNTDRPTTDFFVTFSTSVSTRGYRYEIYKKRTVSRIRATF